MKSVFLILSMIVSTSTFAECISTIRCTPFYTEFAGFGLDEEEIEKYEAAVAGYNLRIAYVKNGSRHSTKIPFHYSSSCLNCGFSTIMRNKNNNATKAKRDCESLLEDYEDAWGYCQ